MKKKKLSRRGLYPFLLAMPFIIFVFIFSYLPLAGWICALYDYKPGLEFSQMEFVGLKYFTYMFQTWSQTKTVLVNTLALSFIGLLCSPLPALFAIMLTEVKSNWFKKLVQTTTTLPNFISWIIVYGLAFSLLSSEGMVNTLLKNSGLISQSIDFLGDPDKSWALMTVLSVWKSLGWNSIIYLAAIAGIDQELYDAASVDGANRWQKIRHVTIPGLSSTYFVLLLLSISNLFSNGMDQYFAFTNPQVANKLRVLDLYIYQMGVVGRQYSFSIAMGIWKTVIGVTLLLLVNQLSKKMRGTSLV